MSYTPTFEITNNIINLVAEISELIGQLKITEALSKNPTLRRENRIKTIQGSLCIEQNSLTLEQITAVIDGKTVLAPPKDIQEVKNAFEIYENTDLLDPYSIDDLCKAHSVLMRGLTADCGEFRNRPVGVVDSKTGEIIHFGTLPDYVPEAIEKLFTWTKNSSLNILIKSSVFHYEFVVIHPFSDGNGRAVRLWHTLILSKQNPFFAWLPIESMIQKRQHEYYAAINYCNTVCSSTHFIEFMLNVIKDTLAESLDTLPKNI